MQYIQEMITEVEREAIKHPNLPEDVQDRIDDFVDRAEELENEGNSILDMLTHLQEQEDSRPAIVYADGEYQGIVYKEPEDNDALVDEGEDHYPNYDPL